MFEFKNGIHVWVPSDDLIWIRPRPILCSAVLWWCELAIPWMVSTDLRKASVWVIRHTCLDLAIMLSANVCLTNALHISGLGYWRTTSVFLRKILIFICISRCPVATFHSDKLQCEDCKTTKWSCPHREHPVPRHCQVWMQSWLWIGRTGCTKVPGQWTLVKDPSTMHW